MMRLAALACLVAFPPAAAAGLNPSSARRCDEMLRGLVRGDGRPRRRGAP